MANPHSVSPPRVAVVQDGARLHYALPVALQRAGMLERMYTDWFVRPPSVSSAVQSVLSVVKPREGRRLAGRYHSELPSSKISTYPFLDMTLRGKKRTYSSEEFFFDLHSKQVANWLLRHGLADGKANTLMGWVRNLDPDLCQTCREKGMRIIPDQMIAPRVVEQQEERIQQARWPDWEPPEPSGGIARTIEREIATWNAADHITCASDYVRAGLLAQGVPAEKISVIPYPIDTTRYDPPQRTGRYGALVVGFVGAVSLRKGAPYFLEVAKRFHPDQVRFTMVGPRHISARMAAKHKDRVQFIGNVPRSEVSDWMDTFDLYFFPSTCEGSATSVMEAMAMGLPVITSPNSGSVVRDGVEGFIRPYDDLDGYAAVIEKLWKDKNLRFQMSKRARQRAEAFDLGYYQRELTALLTGQPISGSSD